MWFYILRKKFFAQKNNCHSKHKTKPKIIGKEEEEEVVEFGSHNSMNNELLKFMNTLYEF